jgi:hypothetical protein
LPHYLIGDAETGTGDQYEHRNFLRRTYSVLLDQIESGNRPKRRVASILAKGVSGLIRLNGADSSVEGSWYGNDTTWRMVHDLNLVLCYASSTGAMNDRPQRRALHVVDGIVGGEGDAPLQPRAHPAGIVLAGLNALAVDLAAATIIGFDPARLPLLRDAWNIDAAWGIPPRGASIHDVTVDLLRHAGVERMSLARLGDHLNLRFLPPPGWVGMVEREPGSRELPLRRTA